MVLGGGLERFEQDVGVVGVTAQAASAHQQRAQRGDAVVGGQREQHVAGGAGGGVQDAGERVVGALGGELGVAQDEPAEASPRCSSSCATTSTSPSALACEPVSSRSTSDVPRRMPLRVRLNPSSRSAAAIAS